MKGFRYIRALSLLLLLLHASAAAQKPAPTAVRTPDPNLVRWKIFLDGLEQQSRAIATERRPYVVAEVAAAYWEVDKAESERLFVAALDQALKLVEQDKKYTDVLDDVLSMGSRLDVGLAKLLTKRIADKQDSKKSRFDIAGSNLNQLLKEDPQRAAELAEALAPDGLALAAPLFIFSLARVDGALANRVYGVYLDRIAERSDLTVQQTVSMCGYALGYPEYYTIDGSGGTYGMTMVPPAGFGPNPRFATRILDLMYRRIAREVAERNEAVGDDIEKRTWRILFAVEYLAPAIERFAPENAAAWEQLRQQVKVGATSEQVRNVAIRVNELSETRARVMSIAESPERLDEMAEASLVDVEKIVGTCQRDLVYMKATLNFSYRKNFKRTLELLDKVEGEARAESIRPAIFYDMAISDAEKGEWEAAEARIKRISLPQLRAFAQIRLAAALAKKNEKAEARRIADAAIVMIEKLEDPKDRAGMYVGLSALYMNIDPLAARTELEKAIKHFNKLPVRDEYYYSYLLQIRMSCEAKPDDPWYGGGYTVDNSDLLDAVRLFARENPDAAKSVVESVGDAATRIRTEAVVAREAFKRLKKEPKKPAAERER
jgi:hypothetical protein